MSLIPFDSPFRHGFVRVAVASTVITIANPIANASSMVQLIHDAQAKHIQVLVTPELGLTGYTCDELFQQTVLLDAVTEALQEICDATTECKLLCFVGAPIRVGAKLYNCAVAINSGRIVGIVPKQNLPGYREYYEPRYFTAFDGDATHIEVNGQTVPFGRDLLFQLGDDVSKLVGVEICEDAWVPDTPSTKLALAGATIICNLSASNITTGKPDYRRQLINSLSARLICAYAYASGGPGESSNDVAWDGHCILSENGSLLAEHQAWLDTSAKITIADVDIDRLHHDRLKFHTFDGPKSEYIVRTESAPCSDKVALQRSVPQFPYVPSDHGLRGQRCEEVYQIQVAGLVQRLRSSGVQRMVIGISGGLDSTHAALICCRAADALGWSRSQIIAVTMPGFATSPRTLDQANALMSLLKMEASTIDIRPSCMQMLKDIGHPFVSGEPIYDVAFENVQAGERTNHLFRLANHIGGIVIGTGDLSELALGWCTYGVGDHMSHYSVNCSVPKTLIQYLIRWLADDVSSTLELRKVLLDIVETEISPELIPSDTGTTQPTQRTEAKVGPYALQDFTLFYFTRFGFTPAKIYYLLQQAWGSTYPPDELAKWLELFIKRFFQNQFKRTCIPNGPKVGSGGSLSPRGDWRMPSDASCEIWVENLRAACREVGSLNNPNTRD
jgi:NAD+ synthase (glutamine-hydrolysing)